MLLCRMRLYCLAEGSAYIIEIIRLLWWAKLVREVARIIRISSCMPYVYRATGLIST